MSNKPTEYKLMPLPATQEMLIAGANVSMEITPRQVARIYEAMWEVIPGFSPKPGPTGQFPEGKMMPGDEGELNIAIGSDPKGNVHLNFGKDIAWLGFSQVTAVAFARDVLQAAGAKKVEIEL